MKKTIGQREVSMADMDQAPQWLLDDALCAKMETNWRDAYTEISASTVDKAANVLSAKLYKRSRMTIMIRSS